MTPEGSDIFDEMTCTSAALMPIALTTSACRDSGGRPERRAERELRCVSERHPWSLSGVTLTPSADWMDGITATSTIRASKDRGLTGQ